MEAQIPAQPPHLRVAIAGLTAAFAAALGVILALMAGWNSPRPVRAPDWRAEELPRRLTARAGETEILLLAHPVADFVLEVEAQPQAGPDFNGYGLVYRAQDEGRYYVFAVGSDGYYAVLLADGATEEELIPWQQFPHVRRGREANRLRVDCAGPTCRFYINDEYAATLEGHLWDNGDIGLWLRGFDGDTAVTSRSASLWLRGTRTDADG